MAKEQNVCDINFTKVKDKSVKIFQGEQQLQGVEIIGSRGKYSIWTDPNNKNLTPIRGKSGNLTDVKKAISSHLCGGETGSITATKKVEAKSEN